jgi:hypothetical protein
VSRSPGLIVGAGGGGKLGGGAKGGGGPALARKRADDEIWLCWSGGVGSGVFVTQAGNVGGGSGKVSVGVDLAR